QRFHRAYVLSEPHEAERAREPCRGLAVRELECDHRAVPALVLAPGDGRLLTRRARRVQNTHESAARREGIGHALRRGRLALDPKRQRAQTLEREPRVPRRLDAARTLAHEAKSRERVLISRDDRAAQGDAVPLEELGRRIDREVRAVLERPLNRRG